MFKGDARVYYDVAVVTEDFLKGGRWDEARVQKGNPDNVPLLKQMQKSVEGGNLEAGNITRLENEECLKSYEDSLYHSDLTTVLLVTSTTFNDSVIGIWEFGGICPPDSQRDRVQCERGRNADGKMTLTMNNVLPCAFRAAWFNCDAKPISTPILYCLAKQFEPRCNVQISLPLLAIVVVLNIIKLGCFIALAFSRQFHPLSTIGDSIASLLERPDETTVSMGPVSISTVKSKLWATGQATPCSISRKPRRWASAASLTPWLICLIL